MTNVKKTGDVIEDKLYIERDGKTNSTFKIHFPNLISDIPTSIGVNVIINREQLKELSKNINHTLAWICPKCGGELHNYRRSELDWDYKKCYNCGWDEQ